MKLKITPIFSLITITNEVLLRLNNAVICVDTGTACPAAAMKQIQPYQAQLSGYLETLQPLYVQLWFNQAESSEEINALLNPNAKNLLAQLKSSAKEHVIW